MRSDKWCYYSDPDLKTEKILKVNVPISKRQAIFIIKKRLQISKIYYIISCKSK